jgi:hypothetical protein
MKLYIKNNNIFYNDINIVRGELSFILVPISIFIILNHKYLIKYINYNLVFIAIVGVIDTIYKFFINERVYFILFSSIILHSLLLYPLLNFKKYMQPNIVNFLFSIIAAIIIKLLPYWPYELSRDTMIIFLICINILFTYCYYLLYKV